MIFEVLAQIALVTGFDERLFDFGVFDVDKLFQFGLNLVIAFFRHIFHTLANRSYFKIMRLTFTPSAVVTRTR